MFQAPRGTSDILPEEQAYRLYIEQKAAEIARLYGYKRIDTPVFEDTDLFLRGVGGATDIVQKEIYTFEDRGGNKLTLRPEGTAPVCRAYLEHGMQNLPQPVKLYYLGANYRYERPQAGRYREFRQFGYEAIGETDTALRTIIEWIEPLKKGVIFYMRGDAVRGVLFWNLFGKLNAARTLIVSSGPHAIEDLRAWAKERVAP